MKFVVIGDSVCWGQGLLEEHKFSNLVASKVGASESKQFAHSGAIIGAHTSDTEKTVAGEVPISLPSILQQLATCHQTDQIDLLLMNGGINDIGVGRILSPWTTLAQLDQLIHQYFYLDMNELFTAVAACMTKPGARVVVLGYYPILSEDSRFFTAKEQLEMLLAIHGVASTLALDVKFDVLDFLPAVIRNCREFWTRSNSQLKDAVAEANSKFAGQPKFVFAPSPFNEQNAVFASHPLLWGLNADLSPQDEVVSTRTFQCDLVYGDLIHLPKLLECRRASAGHPNVEGAAAISEAILSALQ